MCGRLFCLFKSKDEIIEEVNEDLNTKLISDNFQYSAAPPKYNISPTSYLPVLINLDRIESLHWGFKILGLSQIIINARNEDVETKKSFKNLIDNERCIVICSGYYEWNTNKGKGKKSPYSFRPKNKKICYLAALRHKETNSVVLMTREAVPTISHIHTRMPVLLRKDDIPKWLNNNLLFYDIKPSIIDDESYTGKRKGSTDFIEIESTALANNVNNVKVNGPECLQSLKEYKEKSFAKGIGKFFPKV